MNRASITGAWRLVDVTATAEARTLDQPFGDHPSGLLIYTESGTMSAVVTYGRRGRLSGDRVAAPAQERADAFATFFAYGGRYSVDDHRVIHHVELASYENWVGTDLVRVVELQGRRLTLRTPPVTIAGEERVSELVWERIED